MTKRLRIFIVQWVSEIIYLVVPAVEAGASHHEPGAGEREAEDPAGDTEGPAVAQCQPDEPAGK